MKTVLMLCMMLAFTQPAKALCFADPANPDRILQLFEGQDAAIVGVPYEQSIVKPSKNISSKNQIAEYGDKGQTALYKIKVKEWLRPAKAIQGEEEISVRFVLGYPSDNMTLNNPYMILLKKTETGWVSSVCLIRDATVAAESVEVLRQPAAP